MMHHSLIEAIRDVYGSTVSVSSELPVGGGDINRARCLALSNGEKVFVKSNTDKDELFFEDEVGGLEAIASTGTIRVPKTMAVGEDKGCGAFLIMEYVASPRKAAGFWESFASELADMHRADASGFVEAGKYGFYKDNSIPGNIFSNIFSNMRLTFTYGHCIIHLIKCRWGESMNQSRRESTIFFDSQVPDAVAVD